MNEMNNNKPLAFYSLLKNGASEKEIEQAINSATQRVVNKYNAELAAAKAKLEEEKKEEEAATQSRETLAEARAYLINSLLAYNEFFQLVPAEEITDELIEKLEQEIIALEGQIGITLKLLETIDFSGSDMGEFWKKFFS